MLDLDETYAEIETGSTGNNNPYLSIYNPDTEEEYKCPYTITIGIEDSEGIYLEDPITEDNYVSDNRDKSFPDIGSNSWPVISTNNTYTLFILIEVYQHASK